MTETTILPISGEAMPPSYDSEPPEEGGAAGANRRKLLIVGGVAGAAVIAAAAFLLLHGGSPSAAPVTGAVPHGTVRASAPAKAHSGGKTTTLPKKAKAQAGRNPFIPLYVAPSAATGTSVGGTTTVSTAPTPVPTSTSPVTVVSPPPVTTTPPAGLGSPTYLQLLSTNGAKSATFKVGYRHNKFKKYVVLAPKGSSSTGTVFDTEFALIGVQDGQATVQIGDGTPFDLSKGVVRQL